MITSVDAGHNKESARTLSRWLDDQKYTVVDEEYGVTLKCIYTREAGKSDYICLQGGDWYTPAELVDYGYTVKT